VVIREAGEGKKERGARHYKEGQTQGNQGLGMHTRHVRRNSGKSKQHGLMRVRKLWGLLLRIQLPGEYVTRSQQSGSRERCPGCLSLVQKRSPGIKHLNKPPGRNQIDFSAKSSYHPTFT